MFWGTEDKLNIYLLKSKLSSELTYGMKEKLYLSVHVKVHNILLKMTLRSVDLICNILQRQKRISEFLSFLVFPNHFTLSIQAAQYIYEGRALKRPLLQCI